MLRLTGSVADGWISSQPYVPPERAAVMNSQIDEAARSAHREPAEIRRAYNVMGSIGVEDAPGVSGSPERWTENLSSFVLEAGWTRFVLVHR